MKLTKYVFVVLCAFSIVFLSGCKVWDLEEPGAAGRHLKEYVADDKLATTDLKPSIKRWYRSEKERWPVFKRTEIDAGDCYRTAELKQGTVTQ